MTPFTGIRDCGLAWPAGQLQQLTVVCENLQTGQTLADFTSFVLTIREDPDWPRSGSSLYEQLDPASDWGTPSVQATGTPEASPGIDVVFSFNVPSSPGFNRYAIDMQGLSATYGPVQFYPSTWLTVGPSVK